MKKEDKTAEIRVNIDLKTNEKIQNKASDLGISLSDVASDLIGLGLEKHTCGKKSRARIMVMFMEEYDRIINSLGPDQERIKEEFSTLLEKVWLLWHD